MKLIITRRKVKKPIFIIPPGESVTLAPLSPDDMTFLAHILINNTSEKTVYIK